MEEALTSYLLAQSGLVAIVGQRITWARRQQASPVPALVLHLIDRLPQYTLSGSADAISQRVQTDCWGTSYGQVKSMARELTAALSGVSVEEGSGGVAILGSFKEGERDSFEQSTGGEQLYRCSMDFIIWTREGQG